MRPRKKIATRNAVNSAKKREKTPPNTNYVIDIYFFHLKKQTIKKGKHRNKVDNIDNTCQKQYGVLLLFVAFVTVNAILALFLIIDNGVTDNAWESDSLQ